MNCYGPLARWYNALTDDVPYAEFMNFYRNEFEDAGGEFNLILDLCCGTGRLTSLMAENGFEMIGADASSDMLMEARNCATEKGLDILFLNQDVSELDLYGTVDACICSLDSINYIPRNELNELFCRLKFFVRPDGLFIFDIKSPEWIESMDGSTYVDETDDVLCLWRADYNSVENAIYYGMDLFSRSGKLWKRESELHTEYSYEPGELQDMLEKSSFSVKKITTDGPQGELGRIFIVCKRN